MNSSEAAMLCRFTAACCPQQKFDSHTPDAWGILLARWRYDDCKAAVADLAQRQVFVAPAEIITEVKRIRRRRIAEAPPLDPPPHLTPAQTIEWAKVQRERIADGDEPEMLALPPGNRDRMVAVLRAGLRRMGRP